MIAGIFVGGASSRMGSPKGLLRAPSGETLVSRLARVVTEAGLEPLLVGQRAEYEKLGLRSIPDASAEGPLGGLIALLEAANGERVIAIACDMPHVTVELVRKLVHAPDAPVVAPRRGGRWEPLFARYDSSPVLDVAKERAVQKELALQGLLDAAGAAPLLLDDDESALLDDWDAPEDLVAQRREPTDPSLASSTIERPVILVNAVGSSSRTDRIAVEEPLEILEAGTRRPIAVTMRTPGADVDLAAGFLLGEGVVIAREDVVAIAPEGPSRVVVDLAPAARERLERTERRFWITSSCGVCGKSSVEHVLGGLRQHHRVPAERDDLRLSPRLIASLPDALRSAQSSFDRTGALHAAGLFVVDGRALRVAEDVGRHNAVDKVLGAELLSGRVPLTGHILVLSGRIAFELVQKAALAGISAIVAIGAPTSLAIELADSAGITLIGFARDGRFNVYADGYRVILPT